MDIAHTAAAEAATSEPYVCAKCGYSGTGHAVARASATVEQGGFLFGNDRAGEMARDEAEATAWSEAMSDVAMAPCPRCGAVDRAAWAAWMRKPGYLVKAVIGILTLAAGVMGCAAIFTAANLLSMVCAACFGLFAIVAGPAYGILPLVIKRTSTRRVRFDPPGR